MTLQQRSSRTLHLRSRENVGASVSYARPLQRSEPPVILHLDRAKAANSGPAYSNASTASAASAASAESSSSASKRPLDSDSLLQGAKVVQITHNGESYQLRATRHGKLILTK